MNCMLSIVDYMVYILVNLEPKGLIYELYAEHSRLHGIFLGKPLNPRFYSMNCMLSIVDHMVSIYPGKPLNPRVYSINCMLSIVDYMVYILVNL